MINQVSKLAKELYPSLVEWRRDFHKHAESGWVEFRTASIVASKLSDWGFTVYTGQDVILDEARMGVPSEDFLLQQEKRAVIQGADPEWVAHFSGGFTGVVGVLDSGRPGPTFGFRLDMDALDIQESLHLNHFPTKKQFASVNDYMMHACGHDAHTSIGLGVASILSRLKDSLHGRIKMIFQPAEEGVRGAKSMVDAGVLDDVDVFLATHIGTGPALGEMVCGSYGYLSTTKLDVTFTGKSSHAGRYPEEGNNALLAAATATLNLNAIARHGNGASRINTGMLQAGSGRNIIPSSAFLKIETRGDTKEINDYMYKRALQIINSSASMYEVEEKTSIVGAAQSSDPSSQLLPYIRKQAEKTDDIHTVINTRKAMGSEDATYMMERVKKNGGLASYVVFGTTLAAGHHNEMFDIDEKVLRIAVQTLTLCAVQSDTINS